MDNEKKRRYEELELKSKDNIKKLNNKRNILLKECLEALNNGQYTLSKHEELEILERFREKVPIASIGCGCVDWGKVNCIKEVNDVESIGKIVKIIIFT